MKKRKSLQSFGGLIAIAVIVAFLVIASLNYRVLDITPLEQTGSLIWATDFEGGSLPFDSVYDYGGVNELSLDGTHVRSGSGALKVTLDNNGGCYGTKGILETTDFHVGFAVYIPSSLSFSGQYLTFTQIGSGTTAPVNKVDDYTDSWQVEFGGIGYTGLIYPTLPRNTWNEIDIFLV